MGDDMNLVDSHSEPEICGINASVSSPPNYSAPRRLTHGKDGPCLSAFNVVIRGGSCTLLPSFLDSNNFVLGAEGDSHTRLFSSRFSLLASPRAASPFKPADMPFPPPIPSDQSILFDQSEDGWKKVTRRRT